MKLIQHIFWLALLLLPVLAQAQENKGDAYRNEIIQDRVERLMESMTDEDIDLTTLFDELEYYFDHPINLNYASKEELLELPFFNEFNANNLIAHIKKNKKLLSIYELQTIEGFDIGLIQTIMPFVKVAANFQSPSLKPSEVMLHGRHELYLRYITLLEKQGGELPISDSLLDAKPNSRFLGNADKYYLRYRFKYNNNVSWGLTGEKDAGEEFFGSNQPNGFDFTSAHIYLHNWKKFKHLAVGDYQVQIGQGLTFWSGRATRKSALDVINNVKRSPRVIRPYTSVDENNFMRGVAATVELKQLELTAWVSSNKQDANVASAFDTLQQDEQVIITSLQNSGLHRTPAELEDKNALRILTFGSYAKYSGRNWHVGLAVAGADLSIDVQQTVRPYNQFSTIQGQLLKGGIDYNYILGNLNFFGEVSASDNGGIATSNGLLLSLDKAFAMSIHHRYYQPQYGVIYSNGFLESNQANEQGTYVGFEAKPHKHFTLKGYIDRYAFPWLRSNADAPSNGLEYLTELMWKPSKKLETYVRFRRETKQVSQRLATPEIDPLGPQDRQLLRFNFSYKVSDAIKVKTRVETSRYASEDAETQHGFVAMQDIQYDAMSSPLSFSARFALFDTDGFSSAIYTYENDILYVFSILPYYYRGSRWYLGTQYRVSRSMDIWLRYSQTYYSNRDSTGSELTLIDGPRRSDIKAQIRFKF